MFGKTNKIKKVIMLSQFDKFKKKVWRDITVKCVLSALAAALFAVNVVLLPCALCGVRLFWLWYVLIALGGSALGGGIAFLLCRTDDGKIAKRLDIELNLDERTQTALVYSDVSGDMLDLQRDDTDSVLSALPAGKLKFGNLAVTIALAVVLAVGVCGVPIIAVYANTADSGTSTPVDPPRQVTDWEWQALDDLIEYVKASKKADSYTKTGMVTELEGLRGVLQNGVSQSSLSNFVQNTITEIRNIVNAANDRSDITDEQRAANSEEEEYVVNRLYEIFSLKKGGNDDSDVPPEEKPKDEPVTPGNNTGTGELIVGGVPFFDPERGYVSSGDTETREKYYAVIQKALQEGTISRSEWEQIVATYFADLKDDDNGE